MPLFFLLFPVNLFAEHEANHRYLVSGYVRNAAGEALEDTEVNLEHKEKGKKKVRTNSDGYYEARFHLHNENLGDTITVIASGVTKKVKVEFDTEDGVSFRGSSVHFGAESNDNSPIWTFLTIASLVVLSGAVYFGLIKGKKSTDTLEKPRKKKKRKK